jgi:hypothetical protein
MRGHRTFRTVSHTHREFHEGEHRFEHWYVDNQVYFITARCRDRYPAFASSEAKAIFWDRFGYYAQLHGFVPWITSLIDNHYHTLGYLKEGKQLGQMMRKLHGSVAKLVNDLLPERRVPFWRGAGARDYFDGCLRDELQCRRTYRYVLYQCRRHGIGSNPRTTRTRASTSNSSAGSSARRNSALSCMTCLTRGTTGSDAVNACPTEVDTPPTTDLREWATGASRSGPRRRRGPARPR